jgi:uncharacterized protein (TIGR00159 family)
MFGPFADIGMTDILDVFFVAVLLYTVVVYVRKTRASFVVLGLFILGAIYILARQLDLQLTAWIFQGFFAIFLVILVVIFQEELRQMFERIAVWSLRRKSIFVTDSSSADTLVETVADFCRDRIGALIVVPGKDPVGRHIQGGIELNGKLSEPLLKSIFDPHSPGHDGAVVIENDRVLRFAAHLPLSKDFSQLAGVGTRHSAALGLAELTDAFCLVVSEERGKVSVARNGRLWELGSPQQLAGLLQGFVREKNPSKDPKVVSLNLLRENWIEKLIAFSLALLLWYVFVPGSKVSDGTFQIPIAVENLPPNVVVDSVQPREVTVTFTGPRRAFYLFSKEKLKVSVDGSMVEFGRRDVARRTYRITAKDVQYPNDLTIKELEPTTVKIAVRRAGAEAKDGGKSSAEPQVKMGEAG